MLDISAPKWEAQKHKKGNQEFIYDYQLIINFMVNEVFSLKTNMALKKELDETEEETNKMFCNHELKPALENDGQ